MFMVFFYIISFLEKEINKTAYFSEECDSSLDNKETIPISHLTLTVLMEGCLQHEQK